jgi:hypothetical protein
MGSGEANASTDDDGVFQTNFGEDIANAVLRQLFDMIGRCSPANDDPFGEQFKFKVLDPPAGAGLHLGFELLSQFG